MLLKIKYLRLRVCVSISRRAKYRALFACALEEARGDERTFPIDDGLQLQEATANFVRQLIRWIARRLGIRVFPRAERIIDLARGG